MMSCTRYAGALLAIGAALSLSPCGNLSGIGGSSEYGCKAPIGVKCESVSGTYYNSLQNNLPSQRTRHPMGGTNAPPASTPPGSTATPVFTRVSTTTAQGSSGAMDTGTGVPLRSQPKVVRLWIKSWEDADHDLTGDMVVYMQVDNGRWLVDHAQQQGRDAFAPVRAPRSQPAASTSASADGGKPARPPLSSPSDDGPPLAQAIRALQNSAARKSDN